MLPRRASALPDTNSTIMRKHRPINSCDTCRRRRLRCDKSRPVCSRCHTAGSSCTYDDQSSASTAQRTRVAPAQDPDRPSDAHQQEPLATQEQGDSGRLTSEGWGRSTYHASTFWGNVIRSNIDADSTTLPNIIPVKDIPPVTGFLPKVGRLSRKGRLAQPKFGSRCNRCCQRYGLGCIVGFLPQKAVCQKLTNIFFENVFPLMPLFHVPTFDKEQELFWQNKEDQSCVQQSSQAFLEQSPQFLALYFSVLFAALKSSPQSIRDRLNRDEEVTIADLYMAAKLAARLVGFPRKPSLYTLASFILVESQLIREEEFSEGPTFVDTAFRVSLSMGLHRDSSSFHLSRIEAETRRRIWWHAIHLDAMLSSSSGLAPLFQDEFLTSTSRLSEYGDSLDPNNQEHTDIRLFVANCRYRCTEHIRRIVRGHLDGHLQDNQQIQAALDQLVDLETEIRTAVSLLRRETPEMAWATATSTKQQRSGKSQAEMECSWFIDAEAYEPTVAAFRSWAATLLHLMVHKAYVTLLHPLYRISEDKVGPGVRSR